MRILITGALGHIGSKLLRELPKNKNIKKIYLIDNLSTNKFSSLFLLKKKIYNFYEIDLNKIGSKLVEIVKKSDVIVHLAALTDAESSLKKEKYFLNHNTTCSKNIFKLAFENKKKVIFISSTSVYGSQKKIVYEDDNENINPQSPYALSKIKEENLLKKYGNIGLEFIIFRFGTIHGFSTGMRFHTAVNKFIYQSVLKEKITVWETAFKQKRPYLSLKDAIRAINFVIKKDIFPNEIFNVLNYNYTVKEIISEIKKHAQDVQVIFVKNKIMNQLSYKVSNNKFKKLGFNYIGSLNKDLLETYKALKGINNE